MLGIDDGASAGAKESLKVDGSSEQRLELDTGATLTLPKGAVDHDVVIGVERPSDTKAVELVESLKSVKAVASAPYVLTPHGTQFDKDVQLEIPIAKNTDKPLVVAWLKDENDRDWKVLDAAPTIKGNVAVVTLKHFSVLLLLDREKSGLDVEVDAGSNDAGRDEVPDAGTRADAGASAAEDAGVGASDDAGKIDPTPPDAGTPANNTDAAVVKDAGNDQFDASTGLPDASAQLDAGSPNFDGATGADDASVQLPDGGPQLPDAFVDPGDGAAQSPDAQTQFDAGFPDAISCEPRICLEDECGQVDNGCGSPMECGNCEVYGGTCGMYYPNQCGFPID